MKKRNGILILVILFVIGLASCSTPRDAFGNKQTYWERKHLNEIGCPGHTGYVGEP